MCHQCLKLPGREKWTKGIGRMVLWEEQSLMFFFYPCDPLRSVGAPNDELIKPACSNVWKGAVQFWHRVTRMQARGGDSLVQLWPNVDIGALWSLYGCTIGLMMVQYEVVALDTLLSVDHFSQCQRRSSSPLTNS